MTGSYHAVMFYLFTVIEIAKSVRILVEIDIEEKKRNWPMKRLVKVCEEDKRVLKVQIIYS